MSAKSEQTLAMLTECSHTDFRRPAIGPENVITFITNVLFHPVTGSIATKKQS